MAKRSVISAFFVLAVSAVWIGAADSLANQEDEPWVASIGAHKVHLADYRDAYRSYILSTGLPDTPQRRSDFLERMISMRLMALDAESRRLGATPEAELQRERAWQKLLIEGYVTSKVLAPIGVSDQELREMFVRVNTRWKASHLYAGTLAEANGLLDRLQAGVSFEALAAEIFTDEDLRKSGGYLGEFGFDEMDRGFEDAVFGMEPGDISGPVRTAQGYSIIRLEDRFTQPVLTESEFASRIGGLTRYVLVRKHEAARDQLRSDILEELAPEFNEMALKALLQHIAGTSPLGGEGALQPEAILVSHSRGAMTVEAFLTASVLTSEAQRSAVSDASSLRDFVEGLLIRQEIITRAAEAGIAQTSAFEIALRRAENDILYEAAWQDLQNTILVPDDSIQAHMARFPEEFRSPARVRVREILVSDASKATALAQTVTASNFAAMAASHSIRDGAASNGGDLGYVTRAQLGQVALPVFEASTGEIVGPLSVGGRHALFQVLDKIPERASTMEEGREQVEEQLKAAWTRKAVRERVAKLRERHTVEKNLNLLDDLTLRSPDTSSVAPSTP